MVSNLRQSGSTRTLITKWRSLVADKKEETNSVDNSTNQRRGNRDLNVDMKMEESEDDIGVLQELLRQKFGVDENLTVRQQQNKTKTNTYIRQQLGSLNYICLLYTSPSPRD